ncbi:MFS transporter [Pantoea cypripedii]|uniref:MFS transporter n=1 Tax=Pantoea cypripedii TaxID=55209 RepID=UPI002FCCA5CA
MQNTEAINPHSGHWPAVWSLFVGVTGLITGEFLPVSLLTPIAHDLSITAGTAGQSVTASGVIAVITSLLLAPMSRNTDRRYLLLSFTLSLIVSNLIVASATNSFMLFAGRCLLGFAVGGFWTMSSAVAIRLVSEKDVPKALSIIFAGVSLATILAVPLASYLGHLAGWRAVFVGGALIGVAGFLFQFFSLPSLPANGTVKFTQMFGLLRRKWVTLGLLASIICFSGHFAFFTYVRPFLERGLALSPDALSWVLLGFGLSSCVGTTLAGRILSGHFFRAMVIIPLVISATALALLLLPVTPVTDIALVIFWGLVYGVLPVGWSTWITRTMPEDAESAGGLLVAAIQFAITAGAAIGGVMFDHLGFTGIFLTAAVLFFLASFTSRASFRLHH